MLRRTWVLSAAGVAGVVMVLAVLASTGELSAPAAALLDPGVAVRLGLPAARTLHDGAAALTVGSLVVTAFLMAPADPTRPDRLGGARLIGLRLATIAAVWWLVSAVVVLILTAADVAGVPIGAPGFLAVLVSFATQVDLGRASGVSALLIAVVLNLVVLATRIGMVAVAAVVSVLALLPLSLVGHAGGARDHMNAVDSLALHLVAVCLWVGGLAVLVLVGGRFGDQLEPVVRRYSALAGGCFVLVAVSGTINAGLRLGWSPAGLGTGYGLLVLGKTAALLLLGAAGWAHRRHTMIDLRSNRSAFVRLAAVELIVMGATLGLAVALSRSAPPVGRAADPDRTTALLGYPEPPPLNPVNYLSVWYPETVWLLAAVAGAACYLGAVARLRRRGDRWPVRRTIAWLGGCALLIVLTSGGPAVYGMLSFSSHLVQHFGLMILTPIPLVLGAPVTLGLQALDARPDGSLGPREVVLALTRSPVLRALGHPVVAGCLFAAGLLIFYYSPLLDLAMLTHTGHQLMISYFLGVGCLFVWTLVGLDPGPPRTSRRLRLSVLMAIAIVGTGFGLSLRSSPILAGDWWSALGLVDRGALLADQDLGGTLAWVLLGLPSVLLAVLIFGRVGAGQAGAGDRGDLP